MAAEFRRFANIALIQFGNKEETGDMAQVFVGGAMGPIFGHIAGLIVAFVIGFLLLSAVNTAIVDLIAISFLISRDGELPGSFEKLNRYAVAMLRSKRRGSGDDR
ncbi:MAG TPA: hypothetical protein VJX28_08085 [Chthoniobacterales bacterium]|nr:hypothetical protein [Chthoniobacterales bacterium]